METGTGIAAILGLQADAAVRDHWREVLVVDDDDAMLRLCSTILQNAGYEVSVASDGEQAMECIAANPPDFLVTDWRMPRVDGIQLCQWTRQLDLPKYVYTILVTARTETRHMVEAISAGADDFLAKPIRGGELLCRMQAGTRILDRERRLAWLTRHDAMTETLSRTSFFANLDRQWQQSVEEDRPLACVMADVDRFKRINDDFGHLVGDEALKAVARVLREVAGDRYPVCRYGGEEFCAYLSDASEPDALVWAEECRRRIAFNPVAAMGAMVPVTASFGVAERTSDTESPARMLDRADQALRAAKRHGRNRVERYSAMVAMASVAANPPLPALVRDNSRIPCR